MTNTDLAIVRRTHACQTELRLDGVKSDGADSYTMSDATDNV